MRITINAFGSRGDVQPFVALGSGLQAKGEVRSQYTHAIDMVPTVLDMLGIEPPEAIKGVTQSPIEGLSFGYTFKDPAAASNRHTQYFEMMGHRSLYHDGWRAVCPWPGPSFIEAGTGFGNPISAEKLTELDANSWELYHEAEDFAENHNLAPRKPTDLEKVGAVLGLVEETEEPPGS